MWAGFFGATLAAAPALLAPTWVIRLLGPLRRLNPEWVGSRLDRIAAVLENFRQAPIALMGCFAGAVLVQGILVGFYAAIAHGIGVASPIVTSYFGHKYFSFAPANTGSG